MWQPSLVHITFATCPPLLRHSHCSKPIQMKPQKRLRGRGPRHSLCGGGQRPPPLYMRFGYGECHNNDHILHVLRPSCIYLQIRTTCWNNSASRISNLQHAHPCYDIHNVQSQYTCNHKRGGAAEGRAIPLRWRPAATAFVYALWIRWMSWQRPHTTCTTAIVHVSSDEYNMLKQLSLTRNGSIVLS